MIEPWLSNLSVIRITRGLFGIHMPGPQEQSFCCSRCGEEPECAVLASSHVMWMLIAGQGITLRITVLKEWLEQSTSNAICLHLGNL